jgi:hypothetical protein
MAATGEGSDAVGASGRSTWRGSAASVRRVRLEEERSLAGEMEKTRK